MARKNFRDASAAALALLLCMTSLGPLAHSQSAPQPQDKGEEVVRVETELVQTDVTVLDKQGKFVEGLGREQFEVRVDGQAVPVAFAERVTAGSPREEAARSAGGAQRPAAPGVQAGTNPRPRGRTVVFFIDDLHLALDSLVRTRASVEHFVEREMTAQDLVAVVTSSGQLGFLQQLTGSKVMLRAALSRLRHVPNVVRDTERPPMTEYVALRIIRGDREATDFYVDEILKRTVGKGNAANNRRAVAEMVKNRANRIAYELEAVAENSLGSVEHLMDTLAQVPGRKLIFFFSDGFYLDTKHEVGAANDGLRRATGAATRTGSVIYTIDARGLFSLQPDATGDRPLDPLGRIDRASVGESVASQDGLNALAEDTGGRFLSNQNYFDRWITSTLEEAGNYYRVAWRPEGEAQRGGKFKRVEVSVVGRPDLTVRFQRGYAAGATKPGARDKGALAGAGGEGGADAAEARAHAAELRAAFASPAAMKALPTLVSVSFVDVPGSGPALTISAQIETAGLDYGPEGKQAADVDLVGAVWSERGKQAASFSTRLGVAPLAGAPHTREQGVIYNHRTPLAPGLYHVKVAARDSRGGLVGSASDWIEIPDLSKRRLTLSSLHLGGRAVAGAKASDEPQVQFSVDRKFPRSSRVDFLAFVYNAARAAAGGVDLSAQVRVLRDGREAVSARPVKIDAAGDLARIPFTGALTLGRLPAGLYEMEIVVTDNNAKATAAQRVAFEIQ